jgi:chloramphenicol O-acetyltransferase type A
MLPFSLQVHHAVCDGYHASRFIEDLQELVNTCNEWL